MCLQSVQIFHMLIALFYSYDSIKNRNRFAHDGEIYLIKELKSVGIKCETALESAKQILRTKLPNLS